MLTTPGVRSEDKCNEDPGADAAAIAKSLIPKFGVALFDDPYNVGGGWACISGEKPFKFNGTPELSNSTLWVTNIEFNEFNKRARNISNLRQTGYLKTSLMSIANDFGQNIIGPNAMEACAKLADIVKNVMLTSVHTYPWDTPSTDLSSEYLYDDIRRVMPYAPKPMAHVRAALTSAFQPYSMPDWERLYEVDTITLTMRFNRLEYAQKIMATYVPDDAWTFIPPEQVAQMNLADFLNPERPTLVEAEIDFRDVNPVIATLIAFGAQSSNKRGLRKWMSQPELAWVTRHAKVVINSALLSRAARSLPIGCALPDRLLCDPFFSMSISAGLVAESHWNAIATPFYNKATRETGQNSWAVWLRAVDRSLTFSLALKAYQTGFKVSGYGNGSIRVSFPRGRLKECLAFAEDNDIMYPTFSHIFRDAGISIE